MNRIDVIKSIIAIFYGGLLGYSFFDLYQQDNWTASDYFVIIATIHLAVAIIEAAFNGKNSNQKSTLPEQ